MNFEFANVSVESIYIIYSHFFVNKGYVFTQGFPTVLAYQDF